MDSCCLGAAVAVIVMTVATAWVKCCVLWHVHDSEWSGAVRSGPVKFITFHSPFDHPPSDQFYSVSMGLILCGRRVLIISMQLEERSQPESEFYEFDCSLAHQHCVCVTRASVSN